ncbi:MAG: hypothetical protein HUU50_15540 [Candidatus Brocadiae bacterium]|nr:hypothetical protein [Candidatus Brocadiia bacterium]
MGESLVKEKIAKATEELMRYEDGILKKHPHLSLHKYIIAGIGFKRILGLEVK